MLSDTEHGGNSLFRASFHNSVTFCVVLLIGMSVARMPSTNRQRVVLLMANQKTDCREVSGYTSGPVPDTCTVQLPLNGTENDVINSLNVKYRDFPLKCRIRKYILQNLK